MFNILGGRKLTIALIMLVAGMVIDLNTERGLSESLMYLMLGIIGTFSAANAVGKLGVKPQDATKSAEVEAGINTLEAHNTKLELRMIKIEDHAQGIQKVTVDLNGQVENANKRMLAVLTKLELDNSQGAE